MPHQYCHVVETVAIAVTFLVSASAAPASWDVNAPGQVVGVVGPLAFDRAGQAWWVGMWQDDPWRREPSADLPVSIAEVKFLEAAVTTSGSTDPSDARLVSIDDRAWKLIVGTGWILIGTFPGGPVPVETQSFGTVKARHR